MKNILLNIYKFFVAQEFKFEHLGKIVQSVKYPTEQNLAHAAIYTTGLYSSRILESSAKPSVVRPTSDTDESKLALVADQDTVVREVLDLTEEKTSTLDHNEGPLEPDNNTLERQEDYNVSNLSTVSPIGQSEVDKVENVDISEQLDLETTPTSHQIWEDYEGPLTDIDDDTEATIAEEENKPKKKKKKKKKKKAKAAKSKNKKAKKVSKIKEEPVEYSAFTNWLSSLDSLPEAEKKVVGESKAKKKKKKKKKKSAVKISAKKSITKKAGIVSETLATLLIAQGHIEEGIDMLEQLKIKNPDKAEHYELKIQGIKK